MIKCGIIKDLFTQYICGTASEDTRVLVDEHIAECKECAAALVAAQEKMATQLEENDKVSIKVLRRINGRVVKKAVALTAAASMMIFALVMGGNWFVFIRTTPVPYQEGMFRVEQIWQCIGFDPYNCLPILTVYNTVGLRASRSQVLTRVIEIDGVLTEVVFLHHATAIGDRFSDDYDPHEYDFRTSGRYFEQNRHVDGIIYTAPLPMRIYYSRLPFLRTLHASDAQWLTERANATLIWSGILE